jgi:hypothetical protein
LRGRRHEATLGRNYAASGTRRRHPYEEGAVAKTADSLYFGFGFEGVAGVAARNDLMGRKMRYLLR